MGIDFSWGDEEVTDTHPSTRLVMLTGDSRCHDKGHMKKSLTSCMTKLRVNMSLYAMSVRDIFMFIFSC
jgi:hypothetical protein